MPALAERPHTPTNPQEAIAQAFELRGGFVPQAIRRLSPAQLRRLMGDPVALAAFKELERRKVCAPGLAGWLYLLDGYASHKPAGGSGREPLILWPKQRELAELMEEVQALISVKTRRIGMTVISCHRAVRLLAFDPTTPAARCLAVSKSTRHAKMLLREVKGILDSLPGYLLPAGSYGAAAGKIDTTEELEFARGSSIVSLPANGAARGETARWVLWDEAARIETGPVELPQEVAEGLLPTIEGGGQLVIASTGRGRSGRGKVFADLWDKAARGELDFSTFFLGRYDRPGRSERWYQQQVLALGPNRAAQEYPLTPEDALAGDIEGLYFSQSALAEAESLGRHYDELYAKGELPLKGEIHSGTDFGGSTAGVVLYPLANGSLYIADEIYSNDMDAEQYAQAIVRLAAGYGPHKFAWYDAAGLQPARSLIRLAPPGLKVMGVPFGKYKRLSLEHLRQLLTRTEQGQERYRIGISPRCKELLRQLRAMETDDASGMVKKGDDHAVDALLSALPPFERQYRLTYKVGG